MGTHYFIHRGQRSPVDITLALSYLGDTQIELIWQRNDAPCIYTEALQSGFGAGGTHHVAFWPDDLSQAFRELIAREASRRSRRSARRAAK